jgi:hypothetical protein
MSEILENAVTSIILGIEDFQDGSLAIACCPECGAEAYVETGEVSICFSCGESVAGECSRCSADIDVNEYTPDHPELCSYCAHKWEKVMRE